jgi:hypothetical protein
MANQKMLAVLALAVARGMAQDVTTAAAAPTPGTCGTDMDGKTVHSEFKSNLDDRWCATDKGTYESCAGTCCRAMDVCDGAHGADVKGGGVACKTAGHVYSKALAGAVTTKQTANANCCEAEKKCDSFTCPSGWKDRPGKATTTCKNAPDHNVCTKLKCCVVETKTCAGQKAAWSAEETPLACAIGTQYNTAKDTSAMGADLNWGNWQSATGNGCCEHPLTCGGQHAKHGYTCSVSGNADYRDKYEHMFVTSADTAFTGNSKEKWMDACCSTELTKCSDYKCSADLALVSDPTKDTMKCIPGFGFGSSEAANNFHGKTRADPAPDTCQSTCCKKDPTKCRGYDTGNMHTDENCDARYDHEFKDDFADFSKLGMKMNNVVTDHSTYKIQCCSLKLSCPNYKDGKTQAQSGILPEGQASASAAKRKYVLVAAPVLVALGMFAQSG